MNEEMKAKLEKYMQENGFYNTRQIRVDDGMSIHKAKWFDMFGDTEDSVEENKSELLLAAIAYNEEKMDADEAAARDANTADAVLEYIVTYEPSFKAEAEVEKKVNTMNDDARHELVRLMLQRIEAADEAMKLEDEKLLSRHDGRIASACKNRFLAALGQMHLADEHGDHGDQSVWFSFAASHRYANGQTTRAAVETGETEEEMARTGL